MTVFGPGMVQAPDAVASPARPTPPTRPQHAGLCRSERLTWFGPGFGSGARSPNYCTRSRKGGRCLDYVTAQQSKEEAPLKSEGWNPSKFSDLNEPRKFSSATQRRKHQPLKELLAERHRKRLREWEIFQTFCQSTDLGAEPADVIMLDPSSSHPAPPDLKCQLANGPRFFEFGEVVQQNLAEASAPHKEGVDRQTLHAPIRIWDPLGNILTKKLRKEYDPEARPVAL